MNKLLEAAKAVLNQYSKSRSYLSADIDSDVMEALRQALADHIPDVGKKVYVPMTDDEIHDVWFSLDLFNATETMRLFEQAIIQRANLTVKGEE